MNANFLFPNKFRIIGWILLIPAAILGFMVIFKNFEFSFLDFKVLSLLPDTFSTPPSSLWNIVENNFTDEIALILIIIGALLVAFSKEKNEDEYISKIRLESLMWATYITFAIQIFCILFFYEFTFLKAIIINTFTILIVFIIRFNFIIYRSKRQNHEK